MAKSKANSIIHLVPRFSKDSYRGIGGKSTFRKENVESADVERLIDNLVELQKQLDTDNRLPNYLITIKYKSILSKSRRTKRIFEFNRRKPFEYVVGARYYKKDDGYLRHQITYYVSKDNLSNTILLLKNAKEFLDRYFDSKFESKFMDYSNLENQKLIFNESSSMKKNPFFDLMCDISNIESFIRYIPDVKVGDSTLVSFFSVFDSAEDLKRYLLSLGLTNEIEYLDSNTALIKHDYDLDKLLLKNPYIVFQGIVSENEYDFEQNSQEEINDYGPSLKKPENEPTIGAFDSYLDKTAYYSDWVDCVPCYPTNLEIDYKDMIHGTKVCNILVDGPKMNKWLEDGCGNFKVKLFEVALYKKVNTQYIFENLERIVSENPNIKVWNFSLGSLYSVNMNQMSLLGARLDSVAKKYNVIFVVSGTNFRSDYPTETKVGSPADSLNAIVVNSVDENDKPADYTRTGPVLTLYTKPDVAYYGGTIEKPIYAYSPKPGDYVCVGTSFAAPFIARKLAYLIHYLHFEPLVAKALLIDAASRWDEHKDMLMNQKIGYGVVPKHISEIIYSNSDEIKFVISDVTLEYYTKLMTIPVPLDKATHKFRYTAKATLCCFTTGDRKNGVDYSSIEMELKFGRNELRHSKKDNSDYMVVDSINKDKQYDEDGYVDENRACIEFQKWNNTKHLVKKIGNRRCPIAPKYGNFWGLSITQIDRLEGTAQTKQEKYGLKFGVVITLKQIYGEDAEFDSFVNECRELKLNPIIVDEVYNIKLYNEEYSEIKWKD